MDESNDNATEILTNDSKYKESIIETKVLIFQNNKENK